MPQVKLSVVLGKANAVKDVVQSAGAPGSLGTDTIDINIDSTKMSKADAIYLLDEAQQKILASKWPLV